MAMRLVIEMDDRGQSFYGKVHAAGCRDVRDPLPLGVVGSWQELDDAVGEHVGSDWLACCYGASPAEWWASEIKPCARAAVAGPVRAWSS